MKAKANYIWYNGKFVKWQEANIHLLTYGMHYGCGAFEGIRIYNGKAFELEKHVRRLRSSSAVCGIDIPFSDQELVDATANLIEKNELKHGYIRPIAWLNSENLVLASPDVRSEVAIACWPSFYDQKAKPRLKFTIANWRKAPDNSFPNRHKTTASYMVHSMVKSEAKARGFNDALILDQDGYIMEASTSNFFVITDDAVITPAPGNFLLGITRAKVIEICEKNSIPIIERKIHIDELPKLDAIGAFITGTAVELMEIESIELTDQTLHFDQTPKRYTQLLELFQKMTNA